MSPLALLGTLAVFASVEAFATGTVTVLVVGYFCVLNWVATRTDRFLTGRFFVPAYIILAIAVGLLPLVVMPTTSDGQTMLLLFIALSMPMQGLTLSARRSLAISVVMIIGSLSVVGWAIRPTESGPPFPEIVMAVMTTVAVALVDDYAMRHRRLAAHSITSQQASRIDFLTGIDRRSWFADRVDHALAKDAVGSMLFIDLDRFKVINDTLGHGAGDELLAATAKRLSNVVRSHEILGRIGGDEFAVFVPGMNQSAASQLARRVERLFDDDFVLRGKTVPVSASIGVATAVDSSVGRNDLMHSADVAMYAAKRSEGAVRHFDEQMRSELLQIEETELGLRTALRQGSVSAHLQPIVDTKRDCIVGFEALGRWHRDGEIVPAQQFVGAAKRSNLLPQITRAVAVEVLALQAELASVDRPLIGINVEANDVTSFLAWARKNSVEPHDWVLEITEGQVLEGHAEAQRSLREAAAQGYGISLDDLGTGYSSLSRMVQLPIGGVKIDASLIAGVEEDERASAVISAIAHFGARCGLHVVAEGVETAGQVRILGDLGINLMQGYYFYRPASIDDSGSLIAASAAQRPDSELDRKYVQRHT